MLLTETEKALGGLILMGFAPNVPVHVPVELCDYAESHGSLTITTDMDGCYDVTLELEEPPDGR